MVWSFAYMPDQDFRSQQNGAVTRMWRSCYVKPSQKECAIAIGVVCFKKEVMLLQPLRWCCVDCMIHHEWDVREEQQYNTWRRQAIIQEIATHDLYCCLLPVRSFAYMPDRDFRSQQNIAVTRMWRSCHVKPSKKERAIGAVHCKKEGMLL